MFRMGRMIRSAKMKLITPPKLMPPFQSTAASGTLPMEQTKLIIARSGPTSGPQNSFTVGLDVRKNARQNESGTQAARDLGGQELPADEDQQHKAQLDDQVGGRELEDHRVREVGALAEQGARDGHRRVRAARAGGPEGTGERKASKVRPPERPRHG